jgi:hypothetical protein
MSSSERPGWAPQSLAGAEVSDIDLDEEYFEFRGVRLTEARAARLAKEFEQREWG